MDILEESIKKLGANVTNTIAKSNQYKKTFKQANIKCSDAEREDILARAVHTFSNESDRRIDSLLDETEVAAKLDELKELIDSSNELNKKLELDPNADISGHLYAVQSSYDQALQQIKEDIEDELEDKKADLSDKMEIIQELEEKIRHYLNK